MSHAMSNSRMAAVYKMPAAFFVHSLGLTDAGFWIASVPGIRLPADVDVSTLGSAVLKALAGSGPVDVIQPDRAVLAAAHVRSWAQLQRNSVLCNITATREGAIVEPTRNGGATGPNRGFHPLESERIALPAAHSPSEVGEAVVEALARCRAAVA